MSKAFIKGRKSNLHELVFWVFDLFESFHSLNLSVIASKSVFVVII